MLHPMYLYVHPMYMDVVAMEAKLISKSFNEGDSRYNVIKWVWLFFATTSIFSKKETII